MKKVVYFGDVQKALTELMRAADWSDWSQAYRYGYKAALNDVYEALRRLDF